MEKKTHKLIRALEEKGGGHKNYYHYTSVDSVVKILESKRLHLTCGLANWVNDQQEVTCKGTKDEWEKTYFASFTFGDNENMALWGLYGIPKEDAIRIGIPRNAMTNWMSQIRRNKSKMIMSEGPYFDVEDVGVVKKVTLSDMVYIGRKIDMSDINLSHSTISLKAFNDDKKFVSMIDKEKLMTGLIKNAAWKYENEVRIIVRLREAIDCEMISIRLPDEILEKFRITSGPCFKGDIRERLSRKGNIDSPIYDKLSYDKSEFFNLLNYRSICDYCAHESFLSKNIV